MKWRGNIFVARTNDLPRRSFRWLSHYCIDRWDDWIAYTITYLQDTLYRSVSVRISHRACPSDLPDPSNPEVITRLFDKFILSVYMNVFVSLVSSSYVTRPRSFPPSLSRGERGAQIIHRGISCVEALLGPGSFARREMKSRATRTVGREGRNKKKEEETRPGGETSFRRTRFLFRDAFDAVLSISWPARDNHRDKSRLCPLPNCRGARRDYATFFISIKKIVCVSADRLINSSPYSSFRVKYLLNLDYRS